MEPEQPEQRSPASILLEAFDASKLSQRQVEIINRYLSDSEDTCTDSTTTFFYNDTDVFRDEQAELYSYSEEEEFKKNVRAFEDLATHFQYPPSWAIIQPRKRGDFITLTLNLLDSAVEDLRNKAARCILYIVQGCWADLLLESEHEDAVKVNVMLIYNLGAFPILIDLLRLELNNFKDNYTLTIVDSEALRVVCSILYTIIEVFRQEKLMGDESRFRQQLEDLINELLTPIKGELLVITLFNAAKKFLDSYSDYSLYPMRKIMLLIWKIILLTLGGLEDAKKLKSEKRVKLGLPAQHDEFELLYNKYLKDKLLFKPKTHIEDFTVSIDQLRVQHFGYSLLGDNDTLAGFPEMTQDSLRALKSDIYTPLAHVQIEREEKLQSHPLTNQSSESESEINPIEIIFRAMLPDFKSHIASLVKVVYLSFPSRKRKELGYNPLLTDLIRERPVRVPNQLTQIFTLNIDMFKHEEVIFKASSAIILLLLKHFKVNHIYQFEYLARLLVKYDIIEIFNEFCKQNITSYLRTINEVYTLNFPSFLIGYQPVLSIEYMGIASFERYSWRTVFLCVNFLRIINKVAKRKEGRILSMVTLHNYQLLLKFARIKSPIFRYYALKLIKMQMCYTNKSWRKENSFCISEIFLNVRLNHNERFLNHATAENVTTIAELFKRGEEKQLKKCLKRYINRKLRCLADEGMDSQPSWDYREVLAQDCYLSAAFKKNYEKWLALEVFNETDDCDIFFY